VIQREPVEPRDVFFHAMLRPLGLEKGKPFAPDARQRKILTDAVPPNPPIKLFWSITSTTPTRAH
jgi:hypothetical protein